ncbi:glucan-binding YG repeat protein [Paucibacter oligotrophus]|uniref:Glucan-binding YG repeat protein n=1 Tax=Roseateles oligotrophus TaxID=1769250 RepID=A0A840L8W4_9BURK|nr:hypothetical protein [Roseateles oligotrophus]MBB4845024.1 glucan-binding YG repeat protein [Roseateles oligotrophus]
MTLLIALVATAVVVNGARVVIQPGQPLPDLSEHDAQALKASGAAADPTRDDLDKQAAADAAQRHAAAFQAERERVQAELASTATEPAQEQVQEPQTPAQEQVQEPQTPAQEQVQEPQTPSTPPADKPTKKR